MKIRVLKVKAEITKASYEQKTWWQYKDEFKDFQPYFWLLDPTGLDDLDIKVLTDMLKFKYDEPRFDRYGDMIIEATIELACRLGHELTFDTEFTEADDPYVKELHSILYKRDTLGWLDFRHGDPQYKTTE